MSANNNLSNEAIARARHEQIMRDLHEIYRCAIRGDKPLAAALDDTKPAARAKQASAGPSESHR